MLINVLMISLFVSRSSIIVFVCFTLSVYISVGFKKKILFIVCFLIAAVAFYFNKSFLKSYYYLVKYIYIVFLSETLNETHRLNIEMASCNKPN